MSGPTPPARGTLESVRLAPSLDGNRWGKRWPLLLPESIPIMRDEAVPPDEAWLVVTADDGAWMTIACPLTLD